MIEITVAYNHFHALIEVNMDLSKAAQILYGTSARYMRRDFPILKEMASKGMWGGRSALAIKDQKHLANTISYIQSHKPDNTKIHKGVEDKK